MVKKPENKRDRIARGRNASKLRESRELTRDVKDTKEKAEKINRETRVRDTRDAAKGSRDNREYRAIKDTGKTGRNRASSSPKFSKALLVERLRIGGILVVAVVIIFGVIMAVSKIADSRDAQVDADPSATDAPVALFPTMAPRIYEERSSGLVEPELIPNPGDVRNISAGALDIKFSEESITIPGIFDKEILFAAGSGPPNGHVLTDLYYYNLETGQEEKKATTKEYLGEIYEAHINHDYMVWLDTDHGRKNRIYMMNRHTGKISLIKTCTNGMPKLKLYGDILIWMEPMGGGLDSLNMFDMVYQENLTLMAFESGSPYGLSAPALYDNWIVWAGENPEEAEILDSLADENTPRGQTDTSVIFYIKIVMEDRPPPPPTPTPTPEGMTPSPTPTVSPSPTPSPTPEPTPTITPEGMTPVPVATIDPSEGATESLGDLKIHMYYPGTYVHDPVYNGEVFAWIDANKAPTSNLYIAEPNTEPIYVATGVTKFGLGDGILVYGKDEAIWVYIYSTGETSRLTAEGEKGIQPVVNNRTVVWYNYSNTENKDVLRFKVLTDEDLYPKIGTE